MADDDWDRIFETFKRPWKIKPLEKGYRIDDANKRPIVYVYSKGLSQDHKIPSDEEALIIVKAIAKMSKRR